MNKRIVIKIGAGTIQTGYFATVQIGDEGLPAQAEMPARLSAAPDLPGLYQAWRQSYRQLGLSYRLEAIAGETNVSYDAELEQCRLLSRQLRERVHRWLSGEAFRPIREKVLEQLSPQDAARILLQTQDPLLQRLPWYELNFFQRYRNAEVGVCLPCYQQVYYQGSRSAKVKVLAVIGEATGLDTRIDRELLGRLPNADVKVLNAPSREQFDRELWDPQGWDILYFAGHSNSQLDACAEGVAAGETAWEEKARGEILLNATDSLTITQLRHALRKAIDRGLNTAIFNSCDGLGLASDLADLHIPQVLVMREPVPDQVAHAFLRGFLESFSAGATFYVAVREAREKLEGLESRFPCATWLPAIVQNLAETPPTWQSLQGKFSSEETSDVVASFPANHASANHASANHAPANHAPVDPAIDPNIGPAIGVGGRAVTVRSEADLLSSRESAVRHSLAGLGRVDATAANDTSPVAAGWSALRHGWKVAVSAGVGCAALLLLTRSLGWLERFELLAYDYLLQSRPTEPIDKRLLIIRNTDADIDAYPNTTGTRSLSDETLNALLTRLDQLNPQIVGLDIYLRGDITAPQLAAQLKSMPQLVGICKDADYTSDTSAIAPPTELQGDASQPANNKIGASDFVADGRHEIVRRHLLAFLPAAGSSCQVGRTFSEMIASRYLMDAHAIPDVEKNAVVSAQQPFLRPSLFGAYQQEDLDGTQMLLNYRRLKTPSETNCGQVVETPADCMSVSRFLEMTPGDLRSQVENKIVLIGTTANGYGDFWRTPYTRVNSEVPGVFLQAQMISQQVSAVLDGRALLKDALPWQTVGWLVGWALLGGCLGLSIGGYKYWLRLLLAEGALVLLCWLLLVKGSTWMPWVPSAIALPAAALTTQIALKAKTSPSVNAPKTAKYQA